MENLKITRMNFKQQRVAYGIKTKEIADICNLSPLTVSNFEKSTGAYSQTNARDYNADMMCQTLESLITRKLDDMFMKKQKDEARLKENAKLAQTKRLEAGYPKKQIVEYITEYCKQNHISKVEFCKMCGLNLTFLTPSSGNVIYTSSMNKITKATGWTVEQITSGSFVNEKKAPRAVEAEKVVQTFKEKAVASLKEPEEKSNVKYICEDGKYFMEYDVIVVTHKREEISKSTFIQEVSK